MDIIRVHKPQKYMQTRTTTRTVRHPDKNGIKYWYNQPNFTFSFQSEQIRRQCTSDHEQNTARHLDEQWKFRWHVIVSSTASTTNCDVGSFRSTFTDSDCL